MLRMASTPMPRRKHAASRGHRLCFRLTFRLLLLVRFGGVILALVEAAAACCWVRYRVVRFRHALFAGSNAIVTRIIEVLTGGACLVLIHEMSIARFRHLAHRIGLRWGVIGWRHVVRRTLGGHRRIRWGT